MSKLIYVDRLKKDILALQDCYNGFSDTYDKACIIGVIDEQPTIESEIIHCKDCKHRDPEDKKCDCGHDILWQLPRQDDWYCADAERRTDEL